jgi:phenylalanyl-tRNA synthetase beta chain
MGGAHSGCTAETTDVFIESAWFDPSITRVTARETGIDSDAKYRFERGVDPESAQEGLELATRLILEYGGGTPSEMTVAGEAPARPEPIAFDPARVKKLLGLELAEDRIEQILQSLGFGVERGLPWTVSVPSWRRDATQAADLIEDIARIAGYDSLPVVSFKRPEGERMDAPATELQNRVRAARRAAAIAGYDEAVTWSFCRHDEAALFGGAGPGLRLANPISSELDVMRPSALIHLIKAVQKSADRGMDDARYFEAGPIYLSDAPDGQNMVVAAARPVRAGRDWRVAASAPDVFDAKVDALAVLEAAGAPVDNLQISAEARDWWHPGRSGVLRLGKNVLAEFGEVHPRVLKALDVDGRVLAFEVFLDAIPAARKKALKARPAVSLPELNPVRRDFAFLAPADLASDALIRAVKGADKALIADAILFDVYAGQGVPEGQVSLAVEVVLQPTDKTLTDKEIEAVAEKVIAAAKKHGASLRGAKA